MVASEMAHVPVENVTEIDGSFALEKENGKMDKESGAKGDIKFGSIGEERAEKEGNGVADANVPKDAVDEWPSPKQIHTFYFVKSRRYDDPKIQAKITVADKEIDKCNKTRIRIIEELKVKRMGSLAFTGSCESSRPLFDHSNPFLLPSERQELISQVKVLQGENKQYQSLLDEKKKEMEPLQQALGKLRATGGGGRGGICSSEEELNDLIYSLQYRIQHESIPLTEEKQILREIKQLEGTREKVIANAAMRAKIQDSMGQKEAIQDQVKLIGGDLDGVRKEKQAVWQKISGLDEKVKAFAKEIESLQKELETATEKRENAYQSINKLRNQRDEGNTQFFHSRTVLTKVRELAAKKDIAALEELSNTEVDEFMSQWCNNKAFRDDYEKRILPSLDIRMLSRDGRMRNPDEKPLVVVDTPIAPEPEVVAKPIVKKPKEDPKPAPQKDVPKVHKETSKKDSAVSQVDIDVADKDISGLEKQQKKPPVEEQVDEAKLKELKREEEIAKAKQAMERKKKLAEKAAAKAAVRAQKEAEKKLKDREKKQKKKAAASAPTNEAEDPAEEVESQVAEPEKIEANDEAPVVVEKKARKENARLRKQSKDAGSLPRAILKRKKATNYWLWAAPATLVVLILMAAAYYLSSVKSAKMSL